MINTTVIKELPIEINTMESNIKFMENMYSKLGGLITEEENDKWLNILGFMEFVLDSAKEQK